MRGASPQPLDRHRAVPRPGHDGVAGDPAGLGQGRDRGVLVEDDDVNAAVGVRQTLAGGPEDDGVARRRVRALVTDRSVCDPGPHPHRSGPVEQRRILDPEAPAVELEEVVEGLLVHGRSLSQAGYTRENVGVRAPQRRHPGLASRASAPHRTLGPGRRRMDPRHRRAPRDPARSAGPTRMFG